MAVESQVVDQWAVLITTFVLASISIILRVTSRLLTRVGFWWDDYIAAAGYAISVGWMVIVPIWIGHGLGLHIDDVPGDIEYVLYMNKLMLYIAELFYAFGLFFGKAGILAFYWRMFGVTNIKMPIQVLLGCSIIWIIIRTFMGIWHCVPIEAFWDSSAGGYCAIDDSKFFFGTILVHVLIDIGILSLPIIQIRKLNLPVMQKVGVTMMFMFGIFICAAAIAIMVEAVTFDATSIDFTWNISMIVIWASIEVNLVVVSACLPTVRPALNFFLRGRMPGSSAADSRTHPSHARSHNHLNSRGIKMTTLPTDADESSSTYQLADSVNGENNARGEFDNYASDRAYGVATVISGRDSHPGAKAPNSEDSSAGEEGIVVKNETTVKYSKTRNSQNDY